MTAWKPTDAFIDEFAQMLCQETDAAAIEIHAATPDQLMPWHTLTDMQKEVYRTISRRLFRRLYFSPITGYKVLPPQGG